LQGLRADRDQLWAEAMHLYKAGEKWWLDDPKIIEQATQEQKARYQSDPWDVAIEGFVQGKDMVQIAEVLDFLQVSPSKRDQSHQNRVAKSLASFGFERKRVKVGSKRPWFYVRVD
jgi:predicted P-loop ATPase